MPPEAFEFQKHNWFWLTWAHVFTHTGNLPLLKIVLAKGVVDIDGIVIHAELPPDMGGPLCREPLLRAATVNEHLPVVQHLLALGANMWTADTNRPRDGTVFENAIDSGRVDLVLLFVEALKAAGGDAIWPVGHGNDSMVMRRAIHHPRILALLLATGVDPFQPCTPVDDREYATALHAACAYGAVEACEILARVMKPDTRGVSIPDSDGKTPLHFAVYNSGRRCHDMCRQLMKAGADPLAQDSSDCNPMDEAVLGANKAAFRVFLKYGPPVWPSSTLRNYLPSSLSGNPEPILEMVNELVDTGRLSYNLSMKTWKGRTALHVACEGLFGDHSKRFSEMLRIIFVLLEHGADPAVPDDEDGETFFHTFLKCLRHEKYLSYSAINRIFSPHYNLAVRNRYGDTLLHCAARRGYPYILALLLRNVDHDTVFCSNKCGETILHSAAPANGGTDQIVQQVLRAGLDVRTKAISGRTPLHEAVHWRGNLNVVRPLVEAGADLSDGEGGCPGVLHFAMIHADDQTIAYLVEAGAACCPMRKRCRYCRLGMLRWKKVGRGVPSLIELQEAREKALVPDPFTGLDTPTIWGNCFDMTD
jgi:ankyrin repeat protein